MHFLSIISSLIRKYHRYKAIKYFHKKGMDNYLYTAIGTALRPLDVPAKPADLMRVYKKAKKATIILEFGCGNSTAVMAEAIKNKPKAHIYVVETNQAWAEATKNAIPGHLRDKVTFIVSEAHAHIIKGELVHLYDTLPDVVPDFIYLDGPDPNQVIGDCHGMHFGGRRTVMAADILLYESTLKVGATILIDGREQNALYLTRALNRKYRYKKDGINNVHHLALLR